MSTLEVDNLKPSAGGTAFSTGGVAKAWVNFNGMTFGVRDSLNISSMVDLGVGAYQSNLANGFSSANYCCTSSVGRGSIASTVSLAISPFVTDPSPSSYEIRTYTDALAGSDSPYVQMVFHGDLA